MGRIVRTSWIACFLLLAAAAVAQEVLTNDSVIEMHGIGLTESIIVEKIRTSSTRFDTSIEALKRLKAAGISDAVITEMVRAGGPEASPLSGNVTTVDPNDPLSPREPGIYVRDETNGGRLQRMTPTVSMQTKVGGMWKSAFTYGAAKVKSRAILEGEESSLFVGPRPEFYFYFEDTGSFGGISPEEFALVRMRLNKGNREMVVATANISGAKAGALDKFVVEFEASELARGIYRVAPTADMEAGEYGFYYGGAGTGVGGTAAPQGGATRVFDFSVRVGG